MNAVAMQVLGVVMNKMCSTADGLWGVRWNDIPESLQVYAISDTLIPCLQCSSLDPLARLYSGSGNSHVLHW